MSRAQERGRPAVTPRGFTSLSVAFGEDAGAGRLVHFQKNGRYGVRTHANRGEKFTAWANETEQKHLVSLEQRMQRRPDLRDKLLSERNDVLNTIAGRLQGRPGFATSIAEQEGREMGAAQMSGLAGAGASGKGSSGYRGAGFMPSLSANEISAMLHFANMSDPDIADLMKKDPGAATNQALDIAYDALTKKGLSNKRHHGRAQNDPTQAIDEAGQFLGMQSGQGGSTSSGAFAQNKAFTSVLTSDEVKFNTPNIEAMYPGGKAAFREALQCCAGPGSGGYCPW